VEWKAADRTIVCPLTSTSVPVPKAWQPDVRRVDHSEVVVLPSGERLGAVLVRGAQAGLTVHDFLDDINRVSELVGLPGREDIPEDPAIVLDDPVLPGLDFQTGSMSFEFEAQPPYAGTFIVAFHLAQRGDAVCRLVTLERKSDGGAPRVSNVLDGVRSPGLQTVTITTGLTSASGEATSLIPAAACRGWPVWMLPVCTAAAAR
jgi:hypothetical protein